MMLYNILVDSSRQNISVRGYAVLFALLIRNKGDTNTIAAWFVRIGNRLALGSWFVKGFHILVSFIYAKIMIIV